MERHFAILFSLVIFHLPVTSQSVSFTRQDQLLNPVSGFAEYADCAVDMNGDRLDDVVRIGNKGIYIDYLHPDGIFTQRFFSVPLQSVPSWSICAGDIDNNGYTDLLLADLGTASFITATRNGNAYDETVMPDSVFSQRSTLADINNDGWLDGFICNDIDQSIPFRNQGHGVMVPDTNLIHTADRPGNYSAIWTDYDSDGDIDLYLTKCLAGASPGDANRTNLLYRNNDDGTFTEVGEQAGVDDNAQSWTTVFEDFDNDGDFDAFVVNHDEQNRLFRNNGDGTFTNVIANSGIDALDLGAWESAAGDFNNDGYTDIFSELQHELYLGHGDLTFTGYAAPVTPGAISDLNNDGFLDVLKSGQIWTNDGNSNHWIKIALHGLSGNRSGIGARIEIYGEWGIQVREVRSGQSFSPMSSLITHFGLGAAEWIDSLIIKWPSGIKTTLPMLRADSLYFVPEASCVVATSVLALEGSEEICMGDTTTLVAPEGFSAYQWSNNETTLSLEVHEPGMYYAILTDDIGCVTYTQTKEVKMIIEQPPSIFSPNGNTICQGDTLYLHSSYGEHYMWSDGSVGTSTIGVTESGDFTVAVDARCVDGQLTSEPYQVLVLPATSPVINEVTFLPGDSILLSAEGENCAWFDQPAGGNLLGTGCTLGTNAPDHSVTYFVESHFDYPGEIQSGGKTDTTGPGGPGLQSGYLLFEAWTPFELQSVTVYVPTGSPAGTRFIQLRSGDTLLASKSFTVVPGLNVLELHFQIPVGRHILRCPQGNLFRNTGQLNYPYPIGHAGEIMSSSFGKNYYYDFYDWKIKTPDKECVSPRQAVEVIVSGITVANLEGRVTLSPNPTNGIISVDIVTQEEGYSSFRVLDATGHVLLNQAIPEEKAFNVDLGAFPAGVYYLQLTGKNSTGVSRISRI